MFPRIKSGYDRNNINNQYQSQNEKREKKYWISGIANEKKV
jgi:hypothetical protein